jgi:hypothetical protein
MGGRHHDPASLPPRKRRSTRCTGGWVGPVAGMDGFGKSRPPPAFNPRTVPISNKFIDFNLYFMPCTVLFVCVCVCVCVCVMSCFKERDGVKFELVYFAVRTQY